MLIQKRRAESFKDNDSKFDLEHAPYVLVVLDGWGIAPPWGGNAIALAETPVFNDLWQNYPASTLAASGREVGLPENSAGNSEAGHLNIGGGRIVLQDETIIDKQIATGDFFKKPALLETFKHSIDNNSTVHMLGLLSEAGTHSHIDHLFALLDCAKNNGVKKIKVHLFSDGRDSDPMSGIEMVDKVEQYLKKIGVGQIASIMGRYYAMDRDNRWGRTSRAYNALVQGQAEHAENTRQVFSSSYSHGITDEFIEPRLITNKEQEISLICDNDVILMWNFRPDRVKQLTMAFIADHIPEFPDRVKLKNTLFLSFTMYEQHYGHWPIYHIFSPDQVVTPLAKVFSDNGLSQLHVAETEKYAHVTYFFNGGKDKPYPKEEWRLVPSPKVKTYNLTPHMSAEAITNEVVAAINSKNYSLIIINFANADMVGHTGNLKATSQAVAFTDKCLGTVKDAVLNQNGTLFVCADHGNAEQMVNPTTGRADTEHTTNSVPFIIVRNDFKGKTRQLANGRLGDIAPTLLTLAGIDLPTEMSSSTNLIN